MTAGRLRRGRASTTTVGGKLCSITRAVSITTCWSRRLKKRARLNAYVVSDKLANTSAQLRVRVMDFAGKALFERTQPVDVAALSSKVYASFDRQELLKGSDALHAFAVFDL